MRSEDTAPRPSVGGTRTRYPGLKVKPEERHPPPALRQSLAKCARTTVLLFSQKRAEARAPLGGARYAKRDRSTVSVTAKRFTALQDDTASAPDPVPAPVKVVGFFFFARPQDLQFSRRKPSTRSNSSVFAVMRMKFPAIAVPAMRRS